MAPAKSKALPLPNPKEQLITETTSSSQAAETASLKTAATRVCIKNVPTVFDEGKLRRHLQMENVVMTDCKLLKTKEGKSRKMAFVGFKTPEMADSIVRRYNQTYALTCKLQVERAFSKTATTKDRPWSKHSVGSSRHAKLHKTDTPQAIATPKEVKKEESVEWKRKKDEFLSAMGIAPHDTEKTKFWANDDGFVISNVNPTTTRPVSETRKVKDRKGRDGNDEENEKPSDSANITKPDVLKTTIKNVSSDMEFLRSKVVPNLDILSKVDNDVVDKEEGNDGSISDSSSVPSSNSSSDTDTSSASSKDGGSQGALEKVEQQQLLDPTATNENHSAVDVAPNRLFVRNLPFIATEQELCDTFSPICQNVIVECHIPIDDTKRNKGYAFVTFASADDASRVMKEFDGTDFQGRLLHILPGRKGHDDTSFEELDGATHKKQQELARKKEAAHSMTGWSTSFVRGDAVVDNLSNRLGLSKGDILNVKDGLSSGEAAVRLALGETHIIEENREYFQTHGIDMNVLVSSADGKKVPRSPTMILVKNLPYDTTQEEMTKLFHGVAGDGLKQILLPPSRTIALADFVHATDAKLAFRKLAYKRFKHVPLYLEWAPLTLRIESSTAVNSNAEGSTQKETGIAPRIGLVPAAASESTAAPSNNNQATNDDEMEEEDVDQSGGGSNTVYVKNLNFATTEDTLLSTFLSVVGKVRAVSIPKKAPALKRSGGGSTEVNTKSLSMGYGFVECQSEMDARKVIKTLQGTLVNGHALELKLSSKSIIPIQKKTTANGGRKKNTKLMVRNVPFEATRNELYQLFGSFGQLKKVRLPKKFDGNHRGFAFVEFLTGQEAENAMQALSRSHLYGRHLVLEWAEEDNDDDDVDETPREKKAQRHAIPNSAHSNELKNKKIRFH